MSDQTTGPETDQDVVEHDAYALNAATVDGILAAVEVGAQDRSPSTPTRHPAVEEVAHEGRTEE